MDSLNMPCKKIYSENLLFLNFLCICLLFFINTKTQQMIIKISLFKEGILGIAVGFVKKEMKYWYWVLVRLFQNIVNNLPKYWFWFWVLLRPLPIVGLKKFVLLRFAVV